MERYQPWFKYIRDNSKLVLEDFKADFQKLPFSTVYGMEDPEDKLDTFNNEYQRNYDVIMSKYVTLKKLASKVMQKDKILSDIKKLL